MRKRKKEEEPVEEKFLDVDASMQGSISFNDPVNLRINGKFAGSLQTKGTLVISSGAQVKADIKGDSITIAGRVEGDIVARKELKITNPGQLFGNIKTPVLVVTEGAILQGNSEMTNKSITGDDYNDQFYTLDEVTRYLELDSAEIEKWANEGRIPAVREADTWRFEKAKIEEWVSTQK